MTMPCLPLASSDWPPRHNSSTARSVSGNSFLQYMLWNTKIQPKVHAGDFLSPMTCQSLLKNRMSFGAVISCRIHPQENHSGLPQELGYYLRKGWVSDIAVVRIAYEFSYQRYIELMASDCSALLRSSMHQESIYIIHTHLSWPAHKCPRSSRTQGVPNFCLVPPYPSRRDQPSPQTCYGSMEPSTRLQGNYRKHTPLRQLAHTSN